MHYFLSLSPSLSLCLSLSLPLQLMHGGMTKIAHGSVIILSYNWKDKRHMKPDHWLIDFHLWNSFREQKGQTKLVWLQRVKPRSQGYRTTGPARCRERPSQPPVTWNWIRKPWESSRGLLITWGIQGKPRYSSLWGIVKQISLLDSS